LELPKASALSSRIDLVGIILSHGLNLSTHTKWTAIIALVFCLWHFTLLWLALKLRDISSKAPPSQSQV
jgi:hypothetical protein